MIDSIISDLKADEGWRERPYRDTRNLLTVGYGFLIDERMATPMPRAVGDLWLELEVETRWNALLAKLPWLETQPADVQRALGNMAYQLGVAGVLEFKRMLSCLASGDRHGASDEAMDSAWARQTPQRAQRVSNLIRGFP